MIFKNRLFVSYDSKPGWGSMFAPQKQQKITPTSEAVNFLKYNFNENMIAPNIDWSQQLPNLGVADENLTNFMTELGKGNIVLEEGQDALQAYNKYLGTVNTTSKLATVGTKALSVATQGSLFLQFMWNTRGFKRGFAPFVESTPKGR